MVVTHQLIDIVGGKETTFETTDCDQVGFERVNQHVKHAMIQWIGEVVREKFQTLIDTADGEDVFTV